MRTERTTLFQILTLFPPLKSLLAGWTLLGIGLTLSLAQATEIEVNSISEELQLMADELPRPASTTVESGTVTTAESSTKPELPQAKEAPAEKEAAPDKTTPSSKATPSSKETSSNAETLPLKEPAPQKDALADKKSSSAVSANSAASSGDATAPALPPAEPELPKAKSVDLAKPITTEELKTPATKAPAAPQPDPDTGTTSKSDTPSKEALDGQPAAEDKKSSGGEAGSATSKPAEDKTSSVAPPTDDTPAVPAQSGTDPDPTAASAPPAASAAEPEPKPVQPKSLKILGTEVPPSTSTRLAWSPSQSFEGLSMPTPVLVVNGAKDGPTVCLTAAIHGDELNGIEVVRRVLYGLNPKELTGAVIGVPIVNLQGFRRGSRYLTDRRDLNRYFPGNPHGSSGARIAHSFFNSVIRHCDVLVDLHTGSFDRINLPQVRADLRHPGSARLTHNFGATVVLHGTGAEGTLRRAATEYGIPAVTLEAGGPMRLEEANVSHGVAAIRTLLNSLGMIKKFSFWGKPEPVYYQSSWVRVDHGGILFSNVDLGQKVKAGDVLGTVTDPITNIRHTILSTHDGRVIGMALNQVMLPGYAAYHIGIAAKDEINALPADDALLLNDIDLSLSDEDLAELTAKTIVN